MSKKTLGRGLSSLISSAGDIKSDQASALVKDKSKAVSDGIVQIPISRIKPNPWQPRKTIGTEQLEELISSIKERGILLPLIVAEEKPGEYQLIAGERRFRAAQALKLSSVPALIKNIGDSDKLEVSLIENIQRQNLNPIDEAFAYVRLKDEFKLSQEAIAKKVGKRRSTIANLMRLLTLPAVMQTALAEGKLTVGHAKILLSLSSESVRNKFFNNLLKHSWSVSDTNAQAKQTKQKTVKLPDAEIAAWERDLGSALATKVRIAKQGKQGRISIDFYSLEELKNLISRIISGG